MNDTKDVQTLGTWFSLRPTQEGWEVVDRRYRVMENPDPWIRPGETARNNYVVQVLMRNEVYFHQTEVPTLEAALLYIQDDSSKPVFTGGPDSMCRWCREYEYDLRHGYALRACNLCEPEVYPETPLPAYEPPVAEECPDCHEVNGCNVDACICPECWNSKYPSDDFVESSIAWESYKPMMRALNAEDVTWLWGRNYPRSQAPEYNLEIEHAEKHSITITRRGDVWFAELYGEVRRATRWTPPEWDVVDSTSGTDINEIVAWTCRAIANTSD